jgi:hypothetical protein
MFSISWDHPKTHAPELWLNVECQTGFQDKIIQGLWARVWRRRGV